MFTKYHYYSVLNMDCFALSVEPKYLPNNVEQITSVGQVHPSLCPDDNGFSLLFTVIAINFAIMLTTVATFTCHWHCSPKKEKLMKICVFVINKSLAISLAMFTQ